MLICHLRDYLPEIISINNPNCPRKASRETKGGETNYIIHVAII